MKKASKVVFMSDELEKDFDMLKDDDPIKKGIIKLLGLTTLNKGRLIKQAKKQAQQFSWHKTAQTTMKLLIKAGQK